MDILKSTGRKGDKGVVMEGMMARWYAKNTAKDMAWFEADARRIAAKLPADARILEIAPGPGYLSLALARLGAYRVTGLDISRSFVAMAREAAASAGLGVDFRHGDVSDMPFADSTFDFIVCRAAFKNFADPHKAVCEMHRVLKPGGEALIIDLRRNVCDADIDARVDEMGLGAVDGFMTKVIFKTTLRPRAYSTEDFQLMAAATPFGAASVVEDSIGLEVTLQKRG